ncbi:MAG: hypothetical protein J5900_00600 [Prevotella sp.]|nr:hypothetical protein [Prevotella sp.]
MRNIDKRRFKRLRDTSAYISRALKLIDVTDYETEQLRREAELANIVLLERMRRMESYMINVEQLNKKR